MLLGGILLTATARAAVPFKDDLRDCKLPHGEVMLPVSGTAAAGKGDLLKIADGSLAVTPGAGKQQTRVEIAAAVRSGDTADLAFFPEEQGTFWAISGRIVEIGTTYLYEAAAMKLDRPALIPENGGHPAGLLAGLHEGRSFLLETTDGHFALLRVLEITKSGITLQYVYQPSGKINFEIPQGPLVDTTTLPPAAPGPAVPSPATAPAGSQPASTVVGATGPPGTLVLHIGDTPAPPPNVLEPPLSVHLAQRQLLIDSRLKILEAPARTPAEIARKVQAINDLAALHADRAAEPMARQIAFFDPRGAGQQHEFRDDVHPCFAALKKMGKPAADAALKELREMKLDSSKPDDLLQSAGYRAGLLALVIRAVEGDSVGEFILRQERDATTDPARRAVFDQLVGPGK